MGLCDRLLGNADLTEDFELEGEVLRYNLENSVTESLGPDERKDTVRDALEIYLESVSDQEFPVTTVELSDGDETLAFYRALDTSEDPMELSPDNLASGHADDYPASEYTAMQVAVDVERYFEGEGVLGGLVPERDGYPEDLEGV